MSDTLNEYLFSPHSETLSKAELLDNLNYLNDSLLAHGLPASGDLFNPDSSEIKKTIDCIYSLLQQRQKDLNFRSVISERVQKLESEKSMYQQRIETLAEEKNQSFSELGKAQNKLNQELTKFKKEKEKIVSERDDLRKEITKLVGKESKLCHEMKKKETASEKLKEQLRKALGDKDLLLQNNIDLVKPFHLNGPKLVTQSAEEEFTQMIVRGYDDSQNSLLNENQELRSALETIQKELHVLMEERKEDIIRNKQRIPNIDLIHVHPQIFHAPFVSVSEDLIETFVENIQRFKQFMQLTSQII